MFQSLYLAVVHVYLTLQQIEAISYHSVHRSADFWVNILSLEFIWERKLMSKFLPYFQYCSSTDSTPRGSLLLLTAPLACVSWWRKSSWAVHNVLSCCSLHASKITSFVVLAPVGKHSKFLTRDIQSDLRQPTVFIQITDSKKSNISSLPGMSKTFPGLLFLDSVKNLPIP